MNSKLMWENPIRLLFIRLCDLPIQEEAIANSLAVEVLLIV